MFIEQQKGKGAHLSLQSIVVIYVTKTHPSIRVNEGMCFCQGLDSKDTFSPQVYSQAIGQKFFFFFRGWGGHQRHNM